MNRVLLSLQLAALLLAPIIARGEADQAVIVKEVRREKIVQLVEELRRFQPTADTKKVLPTIYENSAIRGAVYRILGEGLIELGTNGWVFIRSHSGHKAPEVGDVVMAIDHRGQIFENSAHVCGGITHFTSIEKVEARDPDDFFSRFSAEANQEKWVRH